MTTQLGPVEEFILTEARRRLSDGADVYGAWPEDDQRDLTLEANAELVDCLHYSLAEIRQLRRQVRDLQSDSTSKLEENRTQRTTIAELRAGNEALMRALRERDETIAHLEHELASASALLFTEAEIESQPEPEMELP
jgi:predicted RNase H-like nuclease (RuvC/YqgF family)